MYYTCRHILPTQLAHGLETTALRERAERVHRRALLVTLLSSSNIRLSLLKPCNDSMHKNCTLLILNLGYSYSWLLSNINSAFSIFSINFTYCYLIICILIYSIQNNTQIPYLSIRYFFYSVTNKHIHQREKQRSPHRHRQIDNTISEMTKPIEPSLFEKWFQFTFV
jgi:hypothetical protein